MYICVQRFSRLRERERERERELHIPVGLIVYCNLEREGESERKGGGAVREGGKGGERPGE